MKAWLGVVSLLALAGALVRLRAWGARAGRSRAWGAQAGAEMRACAVLLELLLAGDVGAELLQRFVLDPAREAGAVPFTGSARLAFHATQLAFLAWPFGIASLSWRLFVRGPGWPVVLAALPFVVLVLAGQYPALRGAELADTYRGLLLFALGLTLAALLLPRPDRFRVGRAHLVSLLLLAGLAAELAGPYLGSPFGLWWTAQVSWSVVLGAVCATAVWGGLWRPAPAS